MYKGEDKIAELLAKKKKATIAQLAAESSFNEDSVRRIIEALRSSGHVTTESSEMILLKATAELAQYGSSEFPEFAVFRKAQSGAAISELLASEKSIGLRWAKVKGYVSIENGKITPAKEYAEVKESHERLLKACAEIRSEGKCSDAEILEELSERRLVDRKVEKNVTVVWIGKAYDAQEAGFDVDAPAANAMIGKNHPITRMTKKMRSIMLELGFQEMNGEIIESSFWNFDALFQPQDHPARELADTFYLEGDTALPEDERLVGRVKKAHEEGWKYKWNPKEAMKRVLRTHTTALSARYVANIRDKTPRKYFAIGRVFRNEATDYKHLAEFHQVEGIVVWQDAKFTDLLGILKEFYRKLGFEKIRFRPSFFPYTEPSLEIEVYFEKRKQWMELGGGGIFRPEVTEPLAGVYPVLAWGLSLERPLMLMQDLEDIRTFYRNDLDFLMRPGLEI